MKKIILYHLLFFLQIGIYGQYYLRGEIRDENNQPLQNVRIFLQSNKYQYFSGDAGAFGITTVSLYDSVVFSKEGYESRTIRLKTDVWQDVQLKINSATSRARRPKLISITKNLKQERRLNWFAGDETYSQIVENEFVQAQKYPRTGFALNINKASYSNIRRFINSGSTVPPDAVRMEELLNYFNLNYYEPAANEVFGIYSKLSDCPWDEQKQLLFLNINAKKVDLSMVPPSNFVFLIDISGSMDRPNRLPLLKAAFQMFVKNLRTIDTVSIVIYGGAVGVWLQPTGGDNKEKIIQAIEELVASGDTPGQAAIMTAYQLANHCFNRQSNNRVILATDGDFNVGQKSEKELEDLITKEKQTGINLTCLGVGMGNYKDSKLEVLAKRGNGNFSYLDDIAEAEKVLVKELTQNFYSIADDVYLDVDFNPAYVKEYRLIGFDNKKDAIQDSTSELEGGDIGTASSMMAIFELLPQHPGDIREKPLLNSSFAKVNLRYSLCKDTSHTHKIVDCPFNYSEFSSLDPSLQFASAVTMFGLKLRQSKFAQDIEWDQIISLATNATQPGNYLQLDFLKLLAKAKKVYEVKKKKKKKSDDD